MKDINKIFLLGRLGKDPIQRETKTGKTVVNFSLATSRRIRNEEAEEGFDERTQWHNLTVWGRQAETCKQFLRKGHTVFVEGSLRSREYEDKEGIKRTAFEVNVDNISFLGAARGRLGADEADEVLVPQAQAS